jgi:hypothetical protein
MAESEIATKIRQGTELFNQGDFEAIRPTLADEFEMHRWLGGFDDGEVVRGPDAFIAWLKPNVFSSMNAEMLDLREAEGKILVTIRSRAVGAASGVELEQDSFQVWEHDGERATKLTMYRDRDEAMRAAGFGDG